MCKFTRTIHVCGHDQHILKTSCPHSFRDKNNNPSCGLIKTRVGPPPSQFIAETVSYPLNTCGTTNCTYTPIMDPFLPNGAVVKFTPRTPPSSRASTWNTPPPLATRFRGTLGKVSRFEVKVGRSNASMLTVGSKQFWSSSKPSSESPPSLDDETKGKQSLYDELLPHTSKLSPGDDLATEFPPCGNTPRPKRDRPRSSSNLPSSPPRRDYSNLTSKLRTEHMPSVMAEEIARMVIGTVPRKTDTVEAMECES